LLLEQLITSKLECALKEVTGSSWTETSQKSTSTLLRNNLPETSNETFVVCDWVELDSSFDAAKIKSQLFIALSRLAQAIPFSGPLRSQSQTPWETTYTSTGVSPPWVTEQQTAPAKANLE
jgi:hypothetical protein